MVTFKAIVAVLAVIAIFFLVGDLKVSLRPFKVSMDSWELATGWLLIGMGVIMIGAFYKYEGYKEGKKEAHEVYRSYLMDTDND